jgi:hypothetical protein
MRGIEGVFVRLWTLKEIELEESWRFREVAIAVEPDPLKCLFGSSKILSPGQAKEWLALYHDANAAKPAVRSAVSL